VDGRGEKVGAGKIKVVGRGENEGARGGAICRFTGLYLKDMKAASDRRGHTGLTL
jgi:hypothetical protein